MKARAELAAEVWPVSYIFDLIRNASLALPDFQRRFEWSVSDVSSYLTTVLAGLPAGSILVADNARLRVELRTLEGAPGLPTTMQEAQVLLDGQQRLTALWQAANSVGPHRFFVDFTSLAQGADLLQDGVLLAVSAQQADRLQDKARAQGDYWVPVSALMSPVTFFAWLGSLSAYDIDENRRTQLGEVFAESIFPLSSYVIPVTRLGGDLTLATVAQVFERLNKGGQRLDTFDLLVARLQASGWNLREAWGDALQRYPHLEQVFGDNGMTTVSAISLMHVADVRRQAVLSLDPEVLISSWSAAVMAASDTASLLLSEGVKRPDLLAYEALATAMIAGRMSGLPGELLTRYFWLASGGSRYDVASNTKLVSDFYHLREGDLSAFQAGWQLRPTDIERNTKRSSRALWSTLIALMLSRRPLDLASGVELGDNALDGGKEWELASFVKGGADVESEYNIPARLRTASQLVTVAGRASSLRRLGLLRIVSLGFERPELFGPTMDERLESQLMPSSHLVMRSADPREIIEYRSNRLYELVEKKAFG